MPSSPPGDRPGSRLARLRGAVPATAYSARKVTALTANPGCTRRAVLDAAGIDKLALAVRIGFPAPYGQSPFAITRGIAFEEQIKANGCAELLTLLRTELDAPISEAHLTDLNSVGGNADLATRAAETRRLLKHTAADRETRLILDHPVLTLEVAGQTAYLEPDAVTHQIGGQFHLVEIKSFAAIDGQADPGKVAEAAKQAAVYVLALRDTLGELGFAPALVADSFLLVCPKDFSNRPHGRLVDLRQQLDAVSYQLARMERAEELARYLLPEHAVLDLSSNEDGSPACSDEQLTRTLEQLPHRYGPRCLDFCELSRHCREQARLEGDPARLGTGVRDDLPGLDNIRTALRLADEAESVSPEQEDAAMLLRAAAHLRGRHLTVLNDRPQDLPQGGVA